MTKVPIIGTFRGRFSNHWKLPAAVAVLAGTLGACAGDVRWSTNRYERGQGLLSSAAELNHVRGAAAPLRQAAQAWTVAWPTADETTVTHNLRVGIARLISDTLGDYPFAETDADDPGAAIRECADRFNAEFKSILKSDPDTAGRYETNVHVEPVLADSNLIVVTASADLYTGGAHGMSPVLHRVFDARTGQPIAFDEAFAPAARTDLLAALTAQLRADKSLKPSQSLKDAGLYEDVLVLTSNYFADATGVGFTYPEYEIAPRVNGPIRLQLSYALVREFLTTGTAVRAEADERLKKAAAP